MRTVRRSCAAVAPMVVGCVVLAGCTGEAVESGAPSDESSVAPEVDLLASLRAAAEWSAEQDRQVHDQIQEGIAACMAEAGFEYVPEAWVEPPEDEYAYGDDSGWNAEYVAAYGFGISMEGPLPEYPPDPNAEYVASLSAEGQEAYIAALGIEGVVSDTDMACRNSVTRRVVAEAPDTTVPELVAQVESEISDEFSALLQDGGRYYAVREEAFQCVVDAGGDRESMGDSPSARGQVVAAYAELVAEGGDRDPDRLAEFQDWERQLASASYACQQPLVAYIVEIQQAATVAVVQRYHAELEALALELLAASESD